MSGNSGTTNTGAAAAATRGFAGGREGAATRGAADGSGETGAGGALGVLDVLDVLDVRAAEISARGAGAGDTSARGAVVRSREADEPLAPPDVRRRSSAPRRPSRSSSGSSGGAPGEPDEQHLERSAGLSAARDIVETLRKTLVQTQEVVDRGAGGERQHVFRFLARQIEELGRVAADLADHEIAQHREQVARDVHEVVPLLGKLGDEGEAALRVARDERG